MSDVAMELYDREREVKELRLSITALDTQIRQLQRQVDAQADGLRRALAAIFQRIANELGGDGGTVPADVPDGRSPRVTAIWNSWKEKFGRDSACSKIIDALLDHEAMNVAQLRAACKIGQQTVYDATSKMKGLSLIEREGGHYRLRKF